MASHCTWKETPYDDLCVSLTLALAVSPRGHLWSWPLPLSAWRLILQPQWPSLRLRLEHSMPFHLHSLYVSHPLYMEHSPPFITSLIPQFCFFSSCNSSLFVFLTVVHMSSLFILSVLLISLFKYFQSPCYYLKVHFYILYPLLHLSVFLTNNSSRMNKSGRLTPA